MLRRFPGCGGLLGRRLYSEVGNGGAKKAKQTFLTGLYENDNAASDLLFVYQKSIGALQLLPSDYYYRQTMEQTLQERIKLLKSTSTGSREQAEGSIGEGLLEEVLEQAREELSLIEEMAIEWKPWESLAEPPPLQE